MTSVIRGDALALPLADNSVDLVVTSPPYFALRSYQDAGEHYAGQIGSEATPAEFVDALIAATREMVRVVKPSGSIWVNLGDKYSGGRGGYVVSGGGYDAQGSISGARRDAVAGFRPKTLLGVPWRYALRCIDDLGLILRAEVIWSKPNGLPESVTDRVRRSHEQWFHFTLEPRYYSAVDEIRVAPAPWTLKAYAYEQANDYKRKQNRDRVDGGNAKDYAIANPLGKLPGSVWEIATEPLKVPAELGVDHFAAFPMEWPRRIIQGWSPSGVCTACGEGRRPVVDRTEKYLHRPSGAEFLGKGFGGPNGEKRGNGNVRTVTKMLGYACACSEPTAPTTPAVVLDPFGGTGTTALVAKALGRQGISVDMSQDYSRLARWRTTDEGELARAMQVKKPEKQIEGQISMLDLLDTEGGAA